MNNEQKQRAIAALTKWWAADSNKAVLSTGYEMAGVLQELVDEQEPKPVAWIMQNILTLACYVYATEQPADPNHIQVPVYTAPPAPEPEPSVPDEQLQAAFDRGLKAGNEQAIAQQIEIHKLHDLLAVQQPEQSDDQVRDAERYRWLRTYNTAKHPAVTEAFFLGDENLDAEIDAAIAAEKGGEA